MKYSSITLEKVSAKKFVTIWSNKFKQNESKTNGSKDRYANNIKVRPLTSESIEDLIKWKNGYHDKIAGSKMKIVNFFKEKKNIEIMNNLSKRWSDKTFEETFMTEKNAPIWKIFIRHVISPNKFPIFDIHVYRAFYYIKSGIIQELHTNKANTYYTIYKTEFLPFFKKMQKQANCNVKELDEALFTYGKFLNNFEDCIIK